MTQMTELIYPPPEMRSIIEKLADHVSKHGLEFEKRALRENNEKLAFLRADNPYRAYYDHRIAQLQAGEAGEGVGKTAPEKPVALLEIEREEEEKKAKRAAKKIKNRGFLSTLALTDQSYAAGEGGELDAKGLQLAKVSANGNGYPDAAAAAKAAAARQVAAPDEEEFSVIQQKMAPLDQDIIKVTAQFVARNGSFFLEELSNRESENPQFDFMKPSHHLFSYFTRLCDAYTKVLLGRKDDGSANMEKLKKLCDDKEFILAKAVQRFQWEEKLRVERKQKNQQEQEERETMEAIDWHDFVVAETITFTKEDDVIPLQAPIDFTKVRLEKTLDPEMQPTIVEAEEEMELSEEMAEEEEIVASEAGEPIKQEELAGADMDGDQATVNPMLSVKQEIQVPVSTAANVKQEQNVQAGSAGAGGRTANVKQEEELIPAEMDFDNINLRTDYVRKRKQDDDKIMQVCPLTGQMVAAGDMADHMRILLMDPQYKTQRDKALEKAKSENYYIDDVERNLGAFAAMRPDLFGTIEQEIEVAAEQGDEAIARQAGADAGPAHTVYNPEATFLAQQRTGPVTQSLRRQRDDEFDSGEESDEVFKPALKRQRFLNTMMPETEFTLKHSDAPAVLLIQVSKDLQLENSAAAGISELEVTLKVSTRISALKASLCTQLGLQADAVKFVNLENDLTLRSGRSLAYYNVGKGARLRLDPRKG